jgi:hypothetical protein
MVDATAILAQSITRAGSKQTFYTARLMVDRDLVNDIFRAYAYFRWADDIVDISSQSNEERISFIQRQKELIDSLYEDVRFDALTPEEEIAADLIRNDREQNSGLQSFIRNMLAIIEFDAHRKGRLISQQELTWYSDILGKSVTDGLQYSSALTSPTCCAICCPILWPDSSIFPASIWKRMTSARRMSIALRFEPGCANA